jgi:hypothetical protein
VHSRNPVAVKTILDAGANLDLSVHSCTAPSQNTRRTPLDVAISNRDTRVIATLLNRGADPVPHVSTWPLYEPTYGVLRASLRKQEGIVVPKFFGLMTDRGKSRERLGSRAIGFGATGRRASDTTLGDI